jgi:AraC-like DNA-binding protein
LTNGTALLCFLETGKAEKAVAPTSREGICKVREFIHAHSAENISLAVMAQIAGVTPHHFASLFRKVTGLSAHQYVLRARVECAKLHLQDDRLSIAEVSRLTGFRTHEHFTKVFRRITGLSPSQFRRSQVDSPNDRAGPG